jgi:hypothetical protein
LTIVDSQIAIGLLPSRAGFVDCYFRISISLALGATDAGLRFLSSGRSGTLRAGAMALEH